MKTVQKNTIKKNRPQRVSNTLNNFEKKDLFPQKTKLAEDILKKFPPPEDLINLK